MKTIEVLGTGCSKCKAAIKLIEEAARSRGVQVEVRKVDKIADIIARGVMSTPAVVVDGRVVVSGRVPSRQEAEAWLE